MITRQKIIQATEKLIESILQFDLPDALVTHLDEWCRFATYLPNELSESDIKKFNELKEAFRHHKERPAIINFFKMLESKTECNDSSNSHFFNNFDFIMTNNKLHTPTPPNEKPIPLSDEIVAATPLTISDKSVATISSAGALYIYIRNRNKANQSKPLKFVIIKSNDDFNSFDFITKSNLGIHNANVTNDFHLFGSDNKTGSTLIITSDFTVLPDRSAKLIVNILPYQIGTETTQFHNLTSFSTFHIKLFGGNLEVNIPLLDPVYQQMTKNGFSALYSAITKHVLTRITVKAYFDLYAPTTADQNKLYKEFSETSLLKITKDTEYKLFKIHIFETVTETTIRSDRRFNRFFYSPNRELDLALKVALKTNNYTVCKQKINSQPNIDLRLKNETIYEIFNKLCDYEFAILLYQTNKKAISKWINGVKENSATNEQKIIINLIKLNNYLGKIFDEFIGEMQPIFNPTNPDPVTNKFLMVYELNPKRETANEQANSIKTCLNNVFPEFKFEFQVINNKFFFAIELNLSGLQELKADKLANSDLLIAQIRADITNELNAKKTITNQSTTTENHSEPESIEAARERKRLAKKAKNARNRERKQKEKIKYEEFESGDSVAEATDVTTVISSVPTSSNQTETMSDSDKKTFEYDLEQTPDIILPPKMTTSSSSSTKTVFSFVVNIDDPDFKMARDSINQLSSLSANWRREENKRDNKLYLYAMLYQYLKYFHSLHHYINNDIPSGFSSCFDRKKATEVRHLIRHTQHLDVIDDLQNMIDLLCILTDNINKADDNNFKQLAEGKSVSIIDIINAQKHPITLPALLDPNIKRQKDDLSSKKLQNEIVNKLHEITAIFQSRDVEKWQVEADTLRISAIKWIIQTIGITTKELRKRNNLSFEKWINSCFGTQDIAKLFKTNSKSITEIEDYSNRIAHETGEGGEGQHLYLFDDLTLTEIEFVAKAAKTFCDMNKNANPTALTTHSLVANMKKASSTSSSSYSYQTPKK